MQMIHEKVKGQLHENTHKYKRREVYFEVGHLVLAHSRKERFLRHEYNKLKLKKISLCKILKKFSANEYEIELPSDIGISLVFNVAELYPCKELGDEK